MFGVSIPELLLVFVLVLVIFGPEKLPEIASTLGKAFAGFKKSSEALRREFYNSVYTPAENFKHKLENETRELTATIRDPDEEKELLNPDPLCPDTEKENQKSKSADE